MNNGAFVELDINKLEKHELIMLGMKKGLEFALARAKDMAEYAKGGGHEFAAGMFEGYADKISQEAHNISVALTACAIRHKAAVMHEFKGGKSDG